MAVAWNGKPASVTHPHVLRNTAVRVLDCALQVLRSRLRNTERGDEMTDHSIRYVRAFDIVLIVLFIGLGLIFLLRVLWHPRA